MRADGGIRHIELHCERVVLRRAVQGMRMAINVRVRDFLGIGVRESDDASMLVLVHRDPSLSIPLCVLADTETADVALQAWSEIFALPQLSDEARDAAPRRRRRNAIQARRPKFLVRRRSGHSLADATVHRDVHEIIARD